MKAWRLILSVFVMSYVSGCLTATKTERFKVEDGLTIVCVDRSKMSDTLRREVEGLPLAPHYAAYYVRKTETIYVPWSGEFDINNQPLPDFRFLGHEMWHHCAGLWHGSIPHYEKTN